MKKVLEYTYMVEAEFNESKNMIHMYIYERRETDNTFVIYRSIPYISGIDNIDTLISRWMRAFSKSDMCNLWFNPAKEGFREELKRLLEEIEDE